MHQVIMAFYLHPGLLLDRSDLNHEWLIRNLLKTVMCHINRTSPLVERQLSLSSSMCGYTLKCNVIYDCKKGVHANILYELQRRLLFLCLDLVSHFDLAVDACCCPVILLILTVLYF